MALPQLPSEELAARLRERAGAACLEAAAWLQKADVLLFCSGAGFSADSGLATYATVAEVEAYARRGLEYHDLCEPRWLTEDPELFWGFWGQCFNDYRNTAPHRGYEILARWAEARFRKGEVADAFREELRLMEPSGYEWEGTGEQPYKVDRRAGAFFAITSNVDAHHYDWFHAHEVRECHGNVELYQCAKGRGLACPGIWRAPRQFRFAVDLSSMLAPNGPSAEPGATDASAARSDEVTWPPESSSVGRVRATVGGRLAALHYLPWCEGGTGAVETAQSFSQNHPGCPFCKGPARPAVLMFEDKDWQDGLPQFQRKQRWVHALLNIIGLRQGTSRDPLRVAILEIGAGARVTSVRNSAEQILRGALAAGGEALLIRVNPEFPVGDEDDFAPGGRLEDRVLSIMMGGLEALRTMDAAMAAAYPARQSDGISKSDVRFAPRPRT
jgi:NAD-dependent SIR2 family protein deacetylase